LFSAKTFVFPLQDMPMKSLPFAAACCFLLVFAAPAPPDDEAPKGDLGKMQGKWTGMIGPEKNVPLVIVLKGQSVAITVTRPDTGQAIEFKGEIRIDEKSKPKQWDWTKFASPDGQEVPDNLAIYDLDGDTLKVCSGGPGNPRPSEFKEGQNGPPTLVTLTRVKDDSKKDGK
jgi:uncharacterized protein (TIGR03067 family)